MKVALDSADVINGAKSYEFTTTQLSGAYYAHVTVSPSGFECAMALTEECTDKTVVYPCAAVLDDFTALPAINTKLGPAATYDGPNGISHSLTWDVTDLWNCDLYANYSVEDASGDDKSSASKTMDWEALITFVQTPD
jgi:hypothetical protein